MITMSDDQAEAIRVEINRVILLATDVAHEIETASMRKGLLAVRMATINAVQVINDIEADIRVRGVAQRETA